MEVTKGQQTNRVGIISPKLVYLSMVCIIATLGGFLFGFDTAVVSGTIVFLKTKFALNAAMEGWVVSSALIGCIIGAASAGWLSDKFGRKKMMILSGLLFLISAVYSAIPENLTVLIFARIFGGVGVGSASMLAPLYIAEFSPPHLRGRMVSLYQFAITIGILVAYFTNSWILGLSESVIFAEGSLLHWIINDEVWRGMFGIETIPAFLFVALLTIVPESPRWLYKEGKEKKALNIISRITDKEKAKKQALEIRKTVQNEPGSITTLLKPGYRIALIAGLGLAMFGQFSGINAVIYYGPKILSEAGLTVSDAFGGQVTIGIVNVLFTFIAIMKADQLGRKPLLFAGISGVFSSMLAIGVMFFFEISGGWVMISVFLIFIACFAFSYGPVVWIINSEIFPTKIRGRAMSIATLSLWVANAIVGQTFPWLLENIGPAYTFWIFAAIAMPAFFFVKKFVPETKGKTLEEIENYWMSYERNKSVESIHSK